MLINHVMQKVVTLLAPDRPHVDVHVNEFGDSRIEYRYGVPTDIYLCDRNSEASMLLKKGYMHQYELRRTLYHEVGHLRYTTGGIDHVDAVLFNALEDGRVERLVGESLRGTREYFQLLQLNHYRDRISKYPATLDSAYFVALAGSQLEFDDIKAEIRSVLSEEMKVFFDAGEEARMCSTSKEVEEICRRLSPRIKQSEKTITNANQTEDSKVSRDTDEILATIEIRLNEVVRRVEYAMSNADIIDNIKAEMCEKEEMLQNLVFNKRYDVTMNEQPMAGAYDKAIIRQISDAMNTLAYTTKRKTPTQSGNRLSPIRYVQGDNRIFRDGTHAYRGGIAVLILLDLSGSMGADEIAGASCCIQTLNEAYRDTKVMLSVVGFTTNSERTVFTMIKDWTDIECYGPLFTDNYTPTGPAIDFGEGMLDRRDERCKIMIIITDGKANVDWEKDGDCVTKARDRIKKLMDNGMYVRVVGIDCLDVKALDVNNNISHNIESPFDLVEMTTNLVEEIRVKT